jgi:hypothetical protein
VAQVPSLRWTFADVMSASRELAKTTEQQRLMQEQGKYFYKIALSEIVTLLNSAVDPSYIVSTPLTMAVDTERLTNTTITAINSTSKVITKSTGVFAVGSYIHVTLVANTGTVTYQWTGRITVGGASATYKLISGTDFTYIPASQHCSVFVEKSNLDNPLSVDISDIYFDRIIFVEDSSIGLCKEMSPEDFSSLGRSSFSHSSYADDIVWTLTGNTIRFKNGEKIKPGTKTLWYQRQPNYPINFDDTDYVDLADKWIPLLIKRIYTLLILQTENDIPVNIAQEMQMDYQLITGYSSAEIANKTKDGKQVSFTTK